MKVDTKAPIAIALFGMDARTVKTMEMYLKGPCQGIAVVVDERLAQVDMIDADHPKAKDILDARRAANPGRPLILLSLQTLRIDNALFIKKPVTVGQMLDVLSQIKAILNPRKSRTEAANAVTPTLRNNTAPEPPEPESPLKMNLQVYAKGAGAAKAIDQVEPEKSLKHQSAMQLNEGGFTTFLGTLPDVDFDDEDQLSTACFDARQFLLGYVEAAYRTAKLQARALQLNSIWKPITILPESREIWLDADDKQLRAFSGVNLNKHSASGISLTTAEQPPMERAPEKTQDMDAFIWKLAIWTSKGRFPIGLDIQRPVYLRNWPNFTRLVITPDALRIAALLVKTPRTPMEIITLLDVKPQYVFVLLSACRTLGLLGQSQRQIDALIAAEPPKRPKNEGLLGKILSKLRGA